MSELSSAVHVVDCPKHRSKRRILQLNHDLYTGGVTGLQAAQEVFQASNLGGTRHVAG